MNSLCSPPWKKKKKKTHRALHYRKQKHTLRTVPIQTLCHPRRTVERLSTLLRRCVKTASPLSLNNSYCSGEKAGKKKSQAEEGKTDKNVCVCTKGPGAFPHDWSERKGLNTGEMRTDSTSQLALPAWYEWHTQTHTKRLIHTSIWICQHSHINTKIHTDSRMHT